MLSIVACQKEEIDPTLGYYDDFNKAAIATSPAKATLTVTQEQTEATLNASFVITFGEDGSATIAYSYDAFNEIGVGSSDEVIVTKTGTVTCDKNGNYSDGTFAFSGTTTIVTGAALNFDAEKMSANFSADGNVVNALVEAANTEAVFGVAIPADITLTAIKNAGRILSFTLEYTTAEGKVSVNCTYE